MTYVARMEDAANFHSQRADAAEDELSDLRRAIDAQAKEWEQSDHWAIHRHVASQRLRKILKRPVE